MGKISRDFQRKKIYDAQRSIWDYRMPPVGDGSLRDIADFITRIMHTTTWERLCMKYGRRLSRPFAVVETGTKTATCSTAMLTFPNYKKTMKIDGYNLCQPWVICHEVAHMAVFHLVYTRMGHVAPHGPEFADAYVDLALEMLGVREGNRLYEAFDDYGVVQHVSSFSLPSEREIENFYQDYDESWYLAKYRETGKAIVVGGADIMGARG